MDTSESELSTDGFADLLAEVTVVESVESSKSTNAQPKSALKSVRSQSDIDADKALEARAQSKTVSIDSNSKTGQYARGVSICVAAIIENISATHTTHSCTLFKRHKYVHAVE